MVAEEKKLIALKRSDENRSFTSMVKRSSQGARRNWARQTNPPSLPVSPLHPFITPV